MPIRADYLFGADLILHPVPTELMSTGQTRKFQLRASPKNSSNKILLLIWKDTLIFKTPKDTSIKILQIRIN